MNNYKRINTGENKNKWAHRVAMEEYLGRKLLTNEYVHHINGMKADNRIDNLMIVTPNNHRKIHLLIATKLKKHKENNLALTTKELIVKINKTEKVLRRLRKEGLPHRKLSYSVIRYNLKEVKKWLKEKKV